MVDVIRTLFRRAAEAAGRHWPSTCVLCSARGAGPTLDLCTDCRVELPLTESACVRCAEPLARTPVAALLCGACLRRPPRFDSVQCAFRYAYPVDRMIQHLKYGSAVTHGRVLGELLADRLERGPRERWPDCVIPVPLAQQRFRERGYNQAIEITNVLERRLPICVRTDLVERPRQTREQADLDQLQRRRNIRGAFAMCGELPGRHVAIVDDVVTTGSTVNELARVLKRAGARRVEVWAVARAGRMK